MKFIIIIAAILLPLIPVQADALCFKSIVPEPCNKNDKSISLSSTAGGNIMHYGLDKYTGTRWKMLERKSGDFTIYSGSTGGKPWSIVKRDKGNLVSYSGISINGERYNFNCSKLGCSSVTNVTGINMSPPSFVERQELAKVAHTGTNDNIDQNIVNAIFSIK